MIDQHRDWGADERRRRERNLERQRELHRARDTYHEETAEHWDGLREQLTLIDKLPSARRRGFIDLEVRCQGCGDAVLEVVATRPVRVLRMTARFIELLRPPGAPTVEEAMAQAEQQGITGMARGAALRETRHPPGTTESIRPGGRSFIPLPWPRPESLENVLSDAMAMCQCRQIDYPLASIYDALEAKTRRVVFPMPDS